MGWLFFLVGRSSVNVNVTCILFYESDDIENNWHFHSVKNENDCYILPQMMPNRSHLAPESTKKPRASTGPKAGPGPRLSIYPSILLSTIVNKLIPCIHPWADFDKTSTQWSLGGEPSGVLQNFGSKVTCGPWGAMRAHFVQIRKMLLLLQIT